MPGAHAVKYLVVLVAALGLSLLNFYVLKHLDVVGIPYLLAAALVLQLLLLVTALFSVVVVLRTPLKILWSIAGSAGQGASQNPYIRVVRARYPGVARWLGRRFSLQEPAGILLTVGTVASVSACIVFVGIARAVATKTTYAPVDQRILNLVPHIRTSGQDAFFAVLALGSSSLALMFFLLVFGLAAWRRASGRRHLMLLAGSAVLAFLCALCAKLLSARPRPDRTLALVDVGSYGFPSAHTVITMVVCGLAAYLLVRALSAHGAQLAVILATVVLLLLVGISRIYLGVSYPSDILGGFALGASILAALLTALEMNERRGVNRSARQKPGTAGSLFLATAATLVLAVACGPLISFVEVTTPAQEEPLSAITSTTVKKLPTYSETFSGKQMEPISFIYLGTQAGIEGLFDRAGWYKADPSTPGNTLRAIVVAVRNDQYLRAPVTPSYLAAEPETMAFEKPTDANTLVQRHHTRIWKTSFVVEGRPVWVATASFDEGIGLGLKTRLPTHHIDPNVDAERSYILRSLKLGNPMMIAVTEPQMGQNSTGDGFFTDGRAAVITVDK